MHEARRPRTTIVDRIQRPGCSDARELLYPGKAVVRVDPKAFFSLFTHDKRDEKFKWVKSRNRLYIIYVLTPEEGCAIINKGLFIKKQVKS